MNKNARYILFLILSLGVVGCSSDDLLNTTKDEELMPVAFSTGFSVSTRSTTLDNLWSSGDAIAVSNNNTTTYKYATAAPSATVSDLVNLTFEDYSQQFFWPTSDPHWSFKAWHPYNNATMPTGVDMTANQEALSEDDYKAYDLLYAETGVIEYKKRVHLKFYHQLAHVVVKATVSTKGGSVSEQVTGISFGNNNVSLKGSLTMGTTGSTVTPSVSWTVADGDKTETVKMRHKSTSGSQYVYDCLLPPQNIGDSATPLITVTTTDGSKSRTYIYKSSYVVRAGYEHTFTLTINELGVLTVDGMTIVSWETGASGTGSVK